MFLFGVGLGPLLWAPLSEAYGRKIAVLVPYALSAIFSFATAVGKDIQTIIITRFFAGFFGSAPITNVGGALSDIWTAQQRGAAVVLYAVTLVAGTVIAPIVGGAVVESGLGWRWTEYVRVLLLACQHTISTAASCTAYNKVNLTTYCTDHGHYNVYIFDFGHCFP